MGGGVGVLVVAGLFLVGLAAKERDNRFCIACHLHEEKFERLSAPTSVDLAGFHHTRDAAVGCIACHGGVDPVMRAKVWAVAGGDTLRFLAGVYAEPRHMRLPLRDAECRQCHRPILRRTTRGAAPADEPETSTNFHAIRDHAAAESGCVRCHTAHTTDGGAPSRFMSPPAVRPICRECHKEMLGALRVVR